MSPKMPNFSIFMTTGQNKIPSGRVKNTLVRGGSAPYLLRVMAHFDGNIIKANPHLVSKLKNLETLVDPGQTF